MGTRRTHETERVAFVEFSTSDRNFEARGAFPNAIEWSRDEF
jgi:hypothetical protein